AGPVGDQAADLEGAAGCAGHGRERSDADAVAAERDLPRNAVPVLVDLELHLDAAVVAAQLELARRLLGAGSADGDAAVAAALGGCGGNREQGGREESDGERDEGTRHECDPFGSGSGLGAASRAPGPSRNGTLVGVKPGAASERRS